MFSGVVKISDLDDFISPSQDCVKPVHIDHTIGKTSRIQIGSDGNYTGITDDGQEYKLKKAHITLNDCLACSGCVTTSETVLISQQSHTEFLKQLSEKRNDKIFVVSISQQSAASLAVRFGLEVDVCFKKLSSYLKSLGVQHVFDIGRARQFSLHETNLEFYERLQSGNHLPLLTSACPGWICYAEKTHGHFILPFISRVKSPQQVMGSLVKRHLSSLLSTDASSIFHATIMPCFDKKLESSRTDFAVEGAQEVDLVLSTVEVEEMLMQSGVNFSSWNFENDSDNQSPLFGECCSSLMRHPGSGSGGYLESALRHIASTRIESDQQHENQVPDKLHYRILRNQDFQEVELMDSSRPEDPPLRFALAYGFRNIQSIVQQLKRKRCRYHFVEIMACPSGCLNGGGQLRTLQMEGETAGPAAIREMLDAVNKAYESLPSATNVLDNCCSSLYQKLSEEDRCAYFRTSYEAVPKIEILYPNAIKW